MEPCGVLFKIKANTTLGQHIRIIGDHPQLGSWNPERGLVLYTNSEIYPFWISYDILTLVKGKSFFKKNNHMLIMKRPENMLQICSHAGGGTGSMGG